METEWGLLVIVINIVDGMKGEFVLIVDGCHVEVDYSDLDIIEHVKIYVEVGMSDSVQESIPIMATTFFRYSRFSLFSSTLGA